MAQAVNIDIGYISLTEACFIATVMHNMDCSTWQSVTHTPTLTVGCFNGIVKTRQKAQGGDRQSSRETP